MTNQKEKIIILIGPTAVGKTKTSIELAKKYNGEIISGDSMQIYKGMDIGTAKITKEETEGISHHLIDIKEPDESFSTAEFQTIVREKITEISSKGKLPIIVGGTGLYIQSVLFDYQFSNAPSDDDFRYRLEERAKVEGNVCIHKELQVVDPVSAGKIHPNNIRRVIRALEVYHCTGKTMTEWQSKQELESVYNAAVIGLTMDRDLLYKRINQRIDMMMDNGLLEEVKGFSDKGLQNCQSMQAIGYKEFYPYFDGLITLDEAVDQLKQNSRRYAKRQLTWFRNKLDVSWIDMSEALDSKGFHKKINEIYVTIEGKLKIKSNT
ncbi:tRNA (adenosine(37)-N6)-dimethylallyltransferase MiaA [Cytobacillus sp. FSL W7-1323]|uniref:tRNA dimethylallyltransferase n=1 Tax=Cytobacillus kochii TaxID=859143 RepID=A0A248TCI5_9BACI|nr:MULTISPECIES: tRNA (adenosine(37)-N6)-dimethylallyltransferase MiaA [Cytobacillus]ASV65873.1 tRNA (adenosine(37)-N6)-dimethylallyltransferase MiaA [Cytobacillus kochii]MDQ0184739.1 tRNA dimethylallyltransferase [Cytobacillus kochii]MEA1852045.1 tRNA (adenosine(37)-N6)-dimethylallyltransferase MiaA [Cytobacillus sp. OWB-43]